LDVSPKQSWLYLASFSEQVRTLSAAKELYFANAASKSEPWTQWRALYIFRYLDTLL